MLEFKKNKLSILMLFCLITFKDNQTNNLPTSSIDNIVDNKKDNNLTHIENLLKNYKRPTTILEITDSPESYALKLASKFKSVYIVLFLGNNCKKLISEIKRNHLHNVVVLNPNNMTYNDIKTLSKCEHFDVSIINANFKKYFKSDHYNAIKTCTKLGDHIFFEINNIKEEKEELIRSNKNMTRLNNNKNRLLYLLKSKKSRLKLARFTQGNKKLYKQTQNYQIESDFNKKLFKKKLLHNAINWTPGINLVTFVMLRGIYPKNQVIYENIKAMQDNIPYHNDLMIGNMVIQGYKIKAIDFKDKRRNANMLKCIGRALRVFDEKSNRLKNPLLCMQQYYKRKK